MGSWGYNSSSSDDCWDLLKATDIHKMSQHEADASLVHAFQTSDLDSAKLGVVMWVLEQGLWVCGDILRNAMEYANAELHPDELKFWKSVKKRKTALITEMNEIRYAQGNGGTGRKKKTEGLLAKAEKVLKAKITVSTTDDFWILKFHDREELLHQAISLNLDRLKDHAQSEVDETISFTDRGNIVFMQTGKGKQNREIGIIGKVQLI